jgi:hypothetical protein
MWSSRSQTSFKTSHILEKEGRASGLGSQQSWINRRVALQGISPTECLHPLSTTFSLNLGASRKERLFAATQKEPVIGSLQGGPPPTRPLQSCRHLTGTHWVDISCFRVPYTERIQQFLPWDGITPRNTLRRGVPNRGQRA